MITSSDKIIPIHGQKYCVTCKQIRDHTCFHMAYRKSEKTDDAYDKSERWNCNRCHTDKTIVKEIPIPTEKGMLVKLLMSLGERYELAGTTISVGLHEVRATFRFSFKDGNEMIYRCLLCHAVLSSRDLDRGEIIVRRRGKT